MDVRTIPVGEHATIDTAAARQTLTALLGPDARARRRAVAAVSAAPERQAPPVLYALSAALVDLGRPAEASFWFYAAQVRARFDANRCADPSAGAAVTALNERFGAQVNRFAFTDLDRLRRTVVRAVAWDRSAPHHYDHRWIALHGMWAFTGADGPLSRPAAEWDAVAARTRAEYLTSFRALLRSVPHPRPEEPRTA